MRESPLALCDQAGGLDRGQDWNFELVGERHFSADDVGEDGQDRRDVIDLHELAHRRDRAFGVTLAVLDHECQRPAIYAAGLI